jgi:hypothetical protein
VCGLDVFTSSETNHFDSIGPLGPTSTWWEGSGSSYYFKMLFLSNRLGVERPREVYSLTEHVPPKSTPRTSLYVAVGQTPKMVDLLRVFH